MITRKQRILFATLGVIAWTTLTAGGTRALLSDAATLTNNGLTTGSANLLISNSQASSSTTYEKVREGFSYTLNPGESVSRYFFLKNTSTSEIMLDTSVQAAITSGQSAMNDAIKIAFYAVDATGGTIGAEGPVIEASLTALQQQRLDLPGPAVGRGATQRYKMVISLAASVSSANQAVSYDLVFNGVQSL
jgi:hypothetical protein